MSSTPEQLESYLSGRWVRGEGVETHLVDPVKGDELATASAKGLDPKAALEFARKQGQGGLRAMSYAERGKLVGGVADVLAANRELTGTSRWPIPVTPRPTRRSTSMGGSAQSATTPVSPPNRRRGADCATKSRCGSARRRTMRGSTCMGGAARRCHPHQCLQFPGLGTVGEGGRVAARRACR